LLRFLPAASLLPPAWPRRVLCSTHSLRITKSSGMRYVHTLTVCYVNGTWQCPGSAPTCN